MDVLSSIDRQFYNFYILGLSSYNPRAAPSNGGFQKFLPAIVLLLLATVLAILSFLFAHNVFVSQNYTNIMCYLFVFLVFITILAAAARSICCSRDLEVIHTKFQAVEVLLRNSFAIDINSRNLVKQHGQKRAVMVLTALVTWFSKCLLDTKKTDMWIESAFQSQLILTLLINFHALFHIGVLRFYSSIFNGNIDDDARQMVTDLVDYSPVETVDRLKIYKRIHFQLCDCADWINGYFGWNLVNLFVFNFFLAIYHIYWIFLYAQEDVSMNKFRIMRKSCDLSDTSLSPKVFSLFRVGARLRPSN